jgi:hypothetical protein
MDVLQELVQFVKGKSQPADKSKKVLQFNVRYTRAIGLRATSDPDGIWKDLSEEPTPVLVVKTEELYSAGLVYALCDVSIKNNSDLEAIIRPVSAFARDPVGIYTNKALPPDLGTENVGSLVLPLTQRVVASELKIVGMRDGSVDPSTGSGLAGTKIQLANDSNWFTNYDVIIRAKNSRKRKYLLPPVDEIDAVFKVMDMQTNGTPTVFISSVSMVKTDNTMVDGGSESTPLFGQAQILGYQFGNRLVQNLGYSSGVVLDNIQTVYLPWVVSVEQVQPNNSVLVGMEFDSGDNLYKIGGKVPAKVWETGTSPLTSFGSATASPLGGQSLPPPAQQMPIPYGPPGAGSSQLSFRGLPVQQQVISFGDLVRGNLELGGFVDGPALAELVRLYKEFEAAKKTFIAQISGLQEGAHTKNAQDAIDSFYWYGMRNGYAELVNAMPQKGLWMIEATKGATKIGKNAYEALFAQFKTAFEQIDFIPQPRPDVRKILEVAAGVQDGDFAESKFPSSASAMTCHLVILDKIHRMDPVGVNDRWLSFHDACVDLVIKHKDKISTIAGQDFTVPLGVVLDRRPGANDQFDGKCPHLSAYVTILTSLDALKNKSSRNIANDVNTVVTNLAFILKTYPADIPVFRDYLEWDQTMFHIDQAVSRAESSIQKLPLNQHAYLDYRFRLRDSLNISPVDKDALVALERSSDVKMVRDALPNRQSFEDTLAIDNASPPASSATTGGGGFLSGLASMFTGSKTSAVPSGGPKASSAAAAAAASTVAPTGEATPIPFSSAEMLKRTAVGIPYTSRMLVVSFEIDDVPYGPYVSTPVSPRVFTRVPTTLIKGPFLALAVEPGRMSLVDRSAFLTRNTWSSYGNAYASKKIEVFSIMAPSITTRPPEEDNWNNQFEDTWNHLTTASGAVSRTAVFDVQRIDRTRPISGPASMFVLSQNGVHIVVQETADGAALRGVYIEA